MNITYHDYDVVIIGTGGAGLMAALKAARKGIKVACVSKVFPTNSHTVAAQGGINAALGNIDEDKVEWHIYDTIRGSDFLADQDAVAYMCRMAPDAIAELEHLGVAFSRNSEGKLDQRIYGGQSGNFGMSPSPHRACFASDRTGHTILHTLYQQCLKLNVTFFNYHLAIDLITDENQCYGIVTLDIETGNLKIILSQNTIIATGGYSQIYQTTTSSGICTGDGNAMVLRAGLPLKDMEFIQFHPTGLYGSGFLISEAARAEGAYLTNSDNKRFMEDYAPSYLDLAPRDVISRAIGTEIFKGNGVGEKKDHVLLHLEHIPSEVIKNRLPEIWHLAKTYNQTDICQKPVAVTPSVHYTMGGIPTNLTGQVINKNNLAVIGLYAIGEAACVSVHGANRLGCNSLLDLIVFGSVCIENINITRSKPTQSITKPLIDRILERFNKIATPQQSDIKPHQIRKSLQETMSKFVGIFRQQSSLNQALSEIDNLVNLSKEISVTDSCLIWNNNLQEILEIQNMLILAHATTSLAINRTESRGSHYRSDYPLRDDANWLKHSLCYRENGKLITTYSKVNITLFEPEPRKY